MKIMMTLLLGWFTVLLLNVLVQAIIIHLCHIQLKIQVITILSRYIYSFLQQVGLWFVVSTRCEHLSRWSARSYLLLCEPIITLDTKLTIALAGCSGSCSANRWHMLSVDVPVFLATKPKILADGQPSFFHFLSWGSRAQYITVLTL